LPELAVANTAVLLSDQTGWNACHISCSCCYLHGHYYSA